MIRLLPDLRGYARFLARDTARADDLVQDALVRALAAIAQFQAGSSMRAWLFTILRNTFFEQSRRRRVERAALDRSGSPEEAVRPAQGGRLDLADLGRVLFTLPPLLREALVLVGVQGLDYAEAAAICAVPVGTMKARVSRARTELNRRLTAEPQRAPILPAPASRAA